MARNFDWEDNLWVVIKEDGTFAGGPCTSYEEAWELSNQHEGSHFYNLELEKEEDYDEPDWIDDDCGYDPYVGCYTGDC